MTIKLLNRLTNRVYWFENLKENALSTDMFYCLDIKLDEGMDDGEYQYFLFDDGVEVAKGILMIGDFQPENTTYNNDEDTTIVYNG